MVEQTRKDPGRKGRPADRGGKTRRSRPDAGRSSGAALGRGRGRRGARTHGRKARPAQRAASKGGRPTRSARSRRTDSHEPRTVVPSNRWRPMRPVGGSPSGSSEPPSPSERPTQAAQQQTEQTPPRHGILGRLFSR